MRRKLVSSVVLVFVLVLQSCGSVDTVLSALYAFRKAEHEVMTSPVMQAKITDPALQQKINAAEGVVDSSWNCMFSAYESAAAKVPAGTAVNVKLADYGPCASRAWDAAFQIITVVRAFDPNFLTANVSYTLPNGTSVAYKPAQFSSPNVPTNIPAFPPAGAITK